MSAVHRNAVIFLAALFVALGIGAVNLGAIFHLREAYGASASTVGWFTASWSALYVLGCVFLQPRFSRLAPARTILISTLSMAFCTGVLVFWKSLPVAFVAYPLSGLATSLFWATLAGWLSDGVPAERLSPTIARFNLSWSIGNVLSPLIAGFLSERASILPLWAGILFFGLGSATVATAVFGPASAGRNVARRSSGPPPEDSCPEPCALRIPSWIGLFAGYVALGTVNNVFPLYAQDVLALSKGTIGLLFFVRAMTLAAGFVLLGRTRFWHANPRTIVGGQVALAAVCVGLAAARGLPALVLLMVALGFLIGLCYDNSIYHGMLGSRDRSRMMAIHESLLSGGIIAGSSGGGFVYQHASMPLLFLCTSAVVTLGAAAQAVTARGPRRL